MVLRFLIYNQRAANPSQISATNLFQRFTLATFKNYFFSLFDMTTIQSIPEEILLTVFSNLSGQDLIQCQYVCRSWFIPGRVKFLNRKVILTNTTKNNDSVPRSTEIPTLDSWQQSERLKLPIQMHRMSTIQSLTIFYFDSLILKVWPLVNR